jgi:hypothetical protein
MAGYTVVLVDDCPDGTLCCLAEVGGEICAVVNRQHGELGYRHTAYHAAHGFDRAQLCELGHDCGYSADG